VAEVQEEVRRVIYADCQQRWRERWEKGIQGVHSRVLQPTLNKKVVALHRKLKRPQSSLVIQLRIGKIGFRAFLFNRKVSEIDSPWCLTCDGQELEIVTHVLLHCLAWKELREECFKDGLKEGTRPTLKALLNVEKGCRAAARMI
jgi:hypothetical protein